MSHAGLFILLFTLWATGRSRLPVRKERKLGTVIPASARNCLSSLAPKGRKEDESPRSEFRSLLPSTFHHGRWKVEGRRLRRIHRSYYTGRSRLPVRKPGTGRSRLPPGTLCSSYSSDHNFRLPFLSTGVEPFFTSLHGRGAGRETTWGNNNPHTVVFNSKGNKCIFFFIIQTS